MIAANGSTKVFSKSGKQVKSFPSNLPGGNRNQNRRNTYTILDCIYSESNSIFYILDMMCWDGFQYYDCDTEFRLSWVQQKFIENQEMRTRSRINPYSFQPLPVYQCTRDSIKEALNSPMPFSDHLDGLLIYHREVMLDLGPKFYLFKIPFPGSLHARQNPPGGLDQGLHGPGVDGH